MRPFVRIETDHEDLVHDLAYDFYGKRLATCSSDRVVKVFDLDASSNRWHLNGELRGHLGSVWRVDWAHPEFGQVLASCSFDNTVRIWEETEDNSGQKRWVERAQLVDSRAAVSDAKFAPRHLGLRLATASQDGRVRIYKSVDALNLAHWSPTEEFEGTTKGGGSNALSWNPSPFGATALAIATSDSAVRVWQKNPRSRKWEVAAVLAGHTSSVLDVSWAPNMGRSYHLIATAGRDHSVRIWRLSDKRAFGAASGGNGMSGTGMSVPSIGSGSGSGGTRHSLLSLSPNRRSGRRRGSIGSSDGRAGDDEDGGESGGDDDGKADRGDGDGGGNGAGGGHGDGGDGGDGDGKDDDSNGSGGGGGGGGGQDGKDGGKDGSGGGGKEGKVGGSGGGGGGGGGGGDEGGLEVTELAVFMVHQAPVWRVSFNLTGTLLASSGDDGIVRMFKPDFQGRWQCVDEVDGV